MLLDLIPEAFQQVAIAWFLLYCAYQYGERKGRWQSDFFYRKLIKYNVYAVSLLYAEAIVLETFVMSEEALPSYLQEDGNPTERWLKQHNTFFWFVLAIHQSLTLGIVGYELLDEKRVKRLMLVGLIPPLLQWHVGLFSDDPMGASILGLILEAVVPVLFGVYGVGICFSDEKKRLAFGFCAVTCYVISVLPVLFLGTQMQSAHHALYLTIFFGALSFFFWARMLVEIPGKFLEVKPKDTPLDDYVTIPRTIPKPRVMTQSSQPPSSPSPIKEVSFSIGGEDDDENKDTSV
jgi:hypothetical protein